MIGIFGDQHLGDRGFKSEGRPRSAGWARSLNDHILTGAAGIFGPAHDDHTQLRRNDVKPVAHVLADPMQAIAAARAGMVLDVDDYLHTRRVAGQRAAVGTTLGSLCQTFRGSSLLVLLLVGRLDLLGFLKPQQQLILGECLSSSAEAVEVQFLDVWISGAFSASRARTIAFSASRSSGRWSAAIAMTGSDHIR
jgi:hypothetical protein